MALTVRYQVRQAKRTDILIISKYIDLEGWEIDINLLYCVYDMAPTAWFIAETEDGDIIGIRALVRFTPSVAAGGVYIVKPEYRGCGIGRAVNQAALKTLGDSTIVISAIDVSQYTKAGFVLDYELSLMRGSASVIKDSLIKMKLDPGVTVTQFKPDMKPDLELYDSKICGHERSYFFHTWILDHAEMILLAFQDKRLFGYGCLSSIRYGLEIAPLYADSDAIAWALLRSLLEYIPEKEEVCMYVCQVNPAMMEFVNTLSLKHVVKIFKMNLRGKVPSLISKIYSASSFCLSVV